MMAESTTTFGAGSQCIRNPVEVILVRRRIVDAAAALGFSTLDTTKLGTAVSELARNVLEHGGGGQAEWEEVRDGSRRGVRVLFSDQGPGIDDIEAAMGNGFTTKGGMGIGLPGARRLVDDMRVVSSPGRGTTVEILKWT